MCEICRQYPCHPRCPNAPEPEAIHICENCGEKITEGERFYNAPSGPVCEECIRNMSGADFMELIGESFDTAERREDPWIED